MKRSGTAWGLVNVGALALVAVSVSASCGGRAVEIGADDGGTSAHDGSIPTPTPTPTPIPIPTPTPTPNPNPNPKPPPIPPPPPTGDCDAGVQGQVCTPACAVTYTKQWRAPHPHQKDCTQANIDLFAKVCLGTQSDGGAACKAFTNSVAGKACQECILPSNGPALGAIIATGGFIVPNLAGCIAIEQGTIADGAGCASASLYLTECRAVACGACAKDPNTTADMINACDNAADQSACAPEVAAAKCIDTLPAPASQCITAAGDFASAYAAIAPVFCLAN